MMTQEDHLHMIYLNLNFTVFLMFCKPRRKILVSLVLNTSVVL